MAFGSVHFFDASRLVSAKGEVTSATVYFYYSGTNVLAPVFTNNDLTTPASNPFSIGAGAIVPQLFLSSDVTYRRRVIFEDGSVHDEDPIAIAPNLKAVYADLADLSAQAVSAAAQAQAASQVAINAGLVVGYYPNARSNIPSGVTGKGTLTPGSGGTNGTFDLAFTGGNFSVNPTGTFVVAGGVVTTVTITGPGLYIGASPTAPTATFGASAGLTGAACPLIVDYLIGGGEFWWTDHATDASLMALYYRNGSTATATSPLQTLVRDASAVLNTVSASLALIHPELTMALGRSFTGVRLTEDGSNGSHICYAPITFVNGTVYKVAFLWKPQTARILNVFCNIGCLFDASFDPLLGTATGTGASIVSLGGGSYYCEVSLAATASDAGNVQFRYYNGSYTFLGDNSSGSYIPWVFIATSVAPSTNLFTSTLLSDASFTKLGTTAANATVTQTPPASLITAYGVTLNGDPVLGSKLVEASGSVSPAIYRGFSFANATTYTAWVKAKAGERTRINLFNNGTGTTFDATFDLVTGIASGTGAAIVALGGDEYLCYVTITTSAAASPNFQVRVFPSAGGQPYTGDGTSGLYVRDAGICTGATPYGANLLPLSYQFSNAVWSKQNISVTPNALVFGSLISAVRTLETKTKNLTSTNYLQGKKWAALGSSITAQGFYTSALVSKSGMILTNLGYSGGSLGQASNGHYGSQKIYDQIPSIPSDSQIVTIESGPNDFAAAAVPLGAIGDTTIATYYGALYASVVAVLAQAPSAKIVFITAYSSGSATPTYAMNATNSNGNTLRQFQKAVLDVGAYLGIPVIDVGQRAGLGWFTASTYTNDGLHINTLGGALHASYDYEALQRIYSAGYFS